MWFCSFGGQLYTDPWRFSGIPAEQRRAWLSCCDAGTTVQAHLLERLTGQGREQVQQASLRVDCAKDAQAQAGLLCDWCIAAAGYEAHHSPVGHLQQLCGVHLGVQHLHTDA